MVNSAHTQHIQEVSASLPIFGLAGTSRSLESEDKRSLTVGLSYRCTKTPREEHVLKDIFGLLRFLFHGVTTG